MVEYIRYKYSGKFGIYFIPAAYADTKWTMKSITDINPVISDDKAIAIAKDVDSNAQAGTDTTYTAKGIELEKGDYYLVITVNKSAYPTNDGTRYYAAIKSISLTQSNSLPGAEYVTYNRIP